MVCLYLRRGDGVADVSWNDDSFCRGILRLDFLLEAKNLLLGRLVAKVMQYETRCAVLSTLDGTRSADASGGPCDTNYLAREEAHLCASCRSTRRCDSRVTSLVHPRRMFHLHTDDRKGDGTAESRRMVRSAVRFLVFFLRYDLPHDACMMGVTGTCKVSLEPLLCCYARSASCAVRTCRMHGQQVRPEPTEEMRIKAMVMTSASSRTNIPSCLQYGVC